MVLYFDLKARYSVPFIGLYLDLGARYPVFLNTVLNFDLRADIRYTDEFGAELLAQSSTYGIYRIWC